MFEFCVQESTLNTFFFSVLDCHVVWEGKSTKYRFIFSVAVSVCRGGWFVGWAGVVAPLGTRATRAGVLVQGPLL